MKRIDFKNLKTVNELIIECLAASGPKNKRLWFSCKKILEYINEHSFKEMKIISTNLIKLTKDGYIERTIKPKEMRMKYSVKTEYLYRWTGKEYVRPNYSKLKTYHEHQHDNIKMARDVKWILPDAPKWFRRMFYY